MDHLNSFSLKGRPVQFAVVGACYGISARTKSKEERESLVILCLYVIAAN